MPDPLTPATRGAKRNLLVASVLAITFKAFDVKVDKIPVAGLSIDFDDRLFSFLLLTTTAYFLVTFVLYYFIDIRNLDTTTHQKTSDKIFSNKFSMFNQEAEDWLSRNLDPIVAPK